LALPGVFMHVLPPVQNDAFRHSLMSSHAPAAFFA
jgi:hypothetical protein